MASPIGRLGLVANEKGLCAVVWERDLPELSKSYKKSSRSELLTETKKQLREYFKGQRKDFELPLVIYGTEFQKKAWKQLQKIPYGKTRSYQEQAKRLGDAKKCRAVGTANGRNPISIIVPCHRVIAKSGSLSGFGGGVEKKEFLLNLEAKKSV